MKKDKLVHFFLTHNLFLQRFTTSAVPLCSLFCQRSADIYLFYCKISGWTSGCRPKNKSFTSRSVIERFYTLPIFVLNKHTFPTKIYNEALTKEVLKIFGT